MIRSQNSLGAFDLGLPSTCLRLGRDLISVSPGLELDYSGLDYNCISSYKNVFLTFCKRQHGFRLKYFITFFMIPLVLPSVTFHHTLHSVQEFLNVLHLAIT